jgi:hypothetical protein|nr:MAG TPA: hypothetical protein [Caudoviricetes sp.]
MARKKKIDKETLISEEFNRLTVIFRDIPNEKRELCTNLMQNAAFMVISLRELQDDLRVNGWIEEYQNGENQSGRKPSSASQVYNKLISNYNNIIKQLVGLLPDDKQESVKATVDPMMEFFNTK